MNKAKSIISYSLYATLICFMSIMTSKYLLITKPFKINNIKISGNEYVSRNEILNMINDYTENQNIINVKLKIINSELEKNNFIHTIKSYTQFPNILLIEVEELTPLALFERNQNFYFMDQSKKIIKANYQAINHYINTPIITNLSDEKISLDKIRYLLIEILNNSNLIYEKLNEVQYLTDKIILVLNNNTKIILKNKNYENDLNKFLNFNKQVLVKNNISLDEYKYIDVSIPEQIITREKNIKKI